MRGISLCHSRDHKQRREQLELNKPAPQAVLNNC